MNPRHSTLTVILLAALLPSLTACMESSVHHRAPGRHTPDAGHTLDAFTGGDVADDPSTLDATAPGDTGHTDPNTGDSDTDIAPDVHGGDTDGDMDVDNGGNDTDTGDTGPGNTDTGDTGPGDTDTGDTGPGDTDTGDTDTGDTGPGDTDTGDTGIDPDADTGVPGDDTDSGGGDPNPGDPILECLDYFGADEACGGVPHGTWTLTEICADIGLETMIQALCPGAIVHDLTYSGSGQTEITPTQFVRDVTLSAEGNVTFPNTCLYTGTCATFPQTIALIMPGAQATCRSAGSSCNCDITLARTDRSTTGYTLNNGVLTLSDDRTFYYCVAGSLTLREFGLPFSDPEVTEFYAP